jgi:drug/metabolite transporter (DMT)-like permease
MQKRQLFMWLAAASGYIGIGMVLAYTMTDKVKNAPAWLGAVLVLLGSILLGMYISSARELKHGDDSVHSTLPEGSENMRN